MVSKTSNSLNTFTRSLIDRKKICLNLNTNTIIVKKNFLNKQKLKLDLI